MFVCVLVMSHCLFVLSLVFNAWVCSCFQTGEGDGPRGGGGGDLHFAFAEAEDYSSQAVPVEPGHPTAALLSFCRPAR